MSPYWVRCSVLCIMRDLIERTQNKLRKVFCSILGTLHSVCVCVCMFKYLTYSGIVYSFPWHLIVCGVFVFIIASYPIPAYSFFFPLLSATFELSFDSRIIEASYWFHFPFFPRVVVVVVLIAFSSNVAHLENAFIASIHNFCSPPPPISTSIIHSLHMQCVCFYIYFNFYLFVVCCCACLWRLNARQRTFFFTYSLEFVSTAFYCLLWFCFVHAEVFQ